MVSCGKRKPTLTVPTKLVTQKSVTVGTRTCDRSDYPLFLGCNKSYLPTNTKLVQLYVKNDSNNTYKLAGNNIQIMSPELLHIQSTALNRMNLLLAGQITTSLLLDVPASIILGATSLVIINYTLYPLIGWSWGTACSPTLGSIVGIWLILPAVTICSFIAIAALASRMLALSTKKHKTYLRDCFEKNVLSQQSNLYLEPFSEINKVFFVTKNDFKSVQKDGVVVSLIDENTEEKLLFAIQV